MVLMQQVARKGKNMTDPCEKQPRAKATDVYVCVCACADIQIPMCIQMESTQTYTTWT